MKNKVASDDHYPGWEISPYLERCLKQQGFGLSLTHLRQVLDNPASFVIKHKPHRAVLYVPGENHQAGYYLKIFHPSKKIKKLFFSFYLSHAAREYYLAKLLLKLGIFTSEPLAFAHWPTLMLSGASLIITREIKHAAPLSEILPKFAPDSDQRKHLLSHYAKLLAQLNSLGFYARDFFMENVLVVSELSGDEKLALIDHEATRLFVGWLSRWREKNLIAAIYSAANPKLSSLEIDLILEEYLHQLDHQKPSAREISQFRLRLERRHEKILELRAKRQIRKATEKSNRTDHRSF